jgi:thiamine kinase-like enzyme
LLDRLHGSHGFGGRLGVLQVIEAHPDQATLVTREVGGNRLSDVFEQKRLQRCERETMSAAYLAGKWLKHFQLISADEHDRFISTDDPAEMVAYCDTRMRKLQNYGYGWPSKAQRQHVLDSLEQLGAQSSTRDLDLVWSHGDYSPGNMIWDGRVITPIDFGMAHADRPLTDVTYFVHRMEMQRVYRPWERRPIATWKRAFLRGYGRPAAEQSPMYRACMIRHLLCRLVAVAFGTRRNLRQAAHDAWVRWCVRKMLEHHCAAAYSTSGHRVWKF